MSLPIDQTTPHPIFQNVPTNVHQSLIEAYRPFGLSLLAVAAAKQPTMMDIQRSISPHSQPLDLSMSAQSLPTTPIQASVIQTPPNSAPPITMVPKPLLPTCNNTNLNSNWIAMKFGAAVGPNRMSYPREFKLMVIDYYYANGQNKYRTCKEFQITKSMLNGWLQKIDKIKESRPGSLKSGRSGRRPQFPSIEKQLFALYQNHLNSGQKVGNRWIRETARSLAQQQCSIDELSGMCQFSERWLSNFKKRYRINLNRDWSSTGSLGDSSASSTTSNGSNHADETGSGTSSGSAPLTNPSSVDISPELSPKLEDNSDSDPTEDTTLTDDMDLSECFDRTPSPEPEITTTTTIANQPVTKSEPPIHQFYRQFPWLCRRPPPSNYEPGRRGRKVQFPQVEKVLYQKLVQRQGAGQRVSNRWLQEEARSLAAHLCPEILAEATKSARCMFSEHWLHNFKKRYGVSLKQQILSRQPTPASQSPTSSVPVDQSEPSQPPANGSPAAMATLLHMQQWLLQQCYLTSAASGQEPQMMGFKPDLPTMVPNTLTQNLLNSGMNLNDWYQKASAAAVNPGGPATPESGQVSPAPEISE